MLLRGRSWRGRVCRFARFGIRKSVDDLVEEVVGRPRCSLNIRNVMCETFENDGNDLWSKRNESSGDKFEERRDPMKTDSLNLLICQEKRVSEAVW